MTSNGTSSEAPVWGIQLWRPASDSDSDWSMPMPSPATAVTMRYWKRPTTAAARAGTTNRV